MNKEEFIKELEILGIKINNKQLEQLDVYYNYLKEENKKYNLTAITEEKDVYLKHFYDSLSLVKIINLNDNFSLCDIGTGAGFPGMVLKIVFPNLKVTLIDATLKKCTFLNNLIQKLELKDIEVINARAEEYSKNVREKYDIVTSRAVAPLSHLLEYSIPITKVYGKYIAMKSDLSHEVIDLQKYNEKLNLKEIKRLEFNLPVENSKRTLIMFEKEKITDIKYPRSYNEIKKKSL